MSNVSDAFSGSTGGATDTTGLDQTFADASLGSQITGGSDLFSPDSTGGSFNSFNTITNALSGLGGATPAAAAPAASAAGGGGDSVGASSGTQSATQPGAAPPQQGGGGAQQGGQPAQQGQQFAPPAAVQELNKLLKALQGKPEGPTGIVQQPAPPSPLPGLSAGETMPLPTLSAGETGPQSPVQSTTPIAQVVNRLMGAPQAGASIPPNAAAQPGRDITVQKPPADAAPAPDQPAPEVAADLPTKKEPPSPPPRPMPPPPQLLQDITGASTGAPPLLGDLARMAMALAPLIGMIGGGKRGRHGGFRHPGGGPWLYHHSNLGWRMHHGPPGAGWLPLDPAHGEQMGIMHGGQGQSGLDPNRPPKETGAQVGPPDQTSSGAIPGVTAKQVDDYTRQAAMKYNIDPNIASKILGQESSFGQARRPGDAGTSFGPFQLHFAPDGRAMGDDFMRDTGKDPRDPRTWKDQVDYAMKRAAQDGWTPGWTTTAKKLGLNQWSGINRKFGGRPMSTTQPQNLADAASIPTTLPVSSTPMVMGQ